MEKIVLSNQEEMEIHGISRAGDRLEVSFKDGDITALEEQFMNAPDLEKIILKDDAGQAMAVFKNFAVLKEIGKKKAVVIDEITDETADIVTVVLEKEPDWMVSQRQQDTRLSAVEETADTLVMEALS